MVLRKCVAAAAALAALCLAGCAQGSEGEVCAVCEYEADGVLLLRGMQDADGQQSVYDALRALERAGEISFAGENSAIGFYLTELNGVAAGANSYWAFYTTLTEADGTSYADPSFTAEVNGVTLYYASKGVSFMPVAAGEAYALVLTQF